MSSPLPLFGSAPVRALYGQMWLIYPIGDLHCVDTLPVPIELFALVKSEPVWVYCMGSSEFLLFFILNDVFQFIIQIIGNLQSVNNVPIGIQPLPVSVFICKGVPHLWRPVWSHKIVRYFEWSDAVSTCVGPGGWADRIVSMESVSMSVPAWLKKFSSVAGVARLVRSVLPKPR